MVPGVLQTLWMWSFQKVVGVDVGPRPQHQSYRAAHISFMLLKEVTKIEGPSLRWCMGEANLYKEGVGGEEWLHPISPPGCS